MKSLVTLSTTLILFLFSNLSQAVSFTEIIHTPSQNSVSVKTQALGISDDGSTISGSGGELIPTGSGFTQKVEEAFHWQAGTSTRDGGSINVPDAFDFHQSLGRGVSADGTFIVGNQTNLENSSSSPISNPNEAFIRSSGVSTMLGFLSGHSDSIANDVSNDGSVVVGSSSLSAVPRAARWVSTVIEDLGVISGDTSSVANSVSADGTVVVGTSTGTQDQAFRWVGSVMTGLGDLTGGAVNSEAFGVSGDGLVVVGHSASSNGNEEAFRWTSSGMVGLSDLSGGSFGSSANAVSQDGITIVGSGTTASGREAFIWDAATGMRNLKDLLVANGINMTGWTLTEATGISSDGKSVVGFGTNPDGNTTGWIVDLLPDVQTGGDFDGDGNADVLWRNNLSGVNFGYTMNGASLDLANSGAINQVSDMSWVIAGIGDFNNDGKDDILWRNRLTGVNYIYIMNGLTIDAAQSGPVNQITDMSWVIVGVGDFNNDGKDDILWRNMANGLNWIYIMDGIAIDFANTGSVNLLTDMNWVVKGVGDFNNDGKDDILWHHIGLGVNWIYIMNGISIDPVNSGLVNIVTDKAWDVKGVGDFNNDGKDDILWRNSTSGLNLIYIMNGTLIDAGTGAVNQVAGQDWEIKQVADSNADGRADIIWRNKNSGLNLMYLMNGISINSFGIINQVSDDSWKINGQ